MNSLTSPLVDWFFQQAFSIQLAAVGLWGFTAGLVLASFLLWLYFQNQKKNIQEHHNALLSMNKQLYEERIAGSERFIEKNKAQEMLIDGLREREGVHRNEIGRLQVKIEQERLRTEEKLDLLREAREELRLQFSELANSILDEKSAHFSKASEEKLDKLLSPFHEQLTSFKRKVDVVHHSETRDRAALQQEIVGLKRLNQRMSEEALNLSRALKGDKRIQGSWGELVLERVLEQSALRKGIEYETQATFRDRENRLFRPDVLVHLPEGRDIIVDSKVSLVSWERYVNCEDKEKRNAFLQSHVKALRDHVKTLGQKDYASLPAIRSLDFVLMFMPVEAAFVTAFQMDDTLFSEAVAQKVILVSPTTLLTTLRTIESIWRYEKQSRNAQEIAQRAAALYDKFCLFAEDMVRIGTQMDAVRNSYDSAMTRLSRGRGNLVSRVERFPQMGVKVKKSLSATITTDGE